MNVTLQGTNVDLTDDIRAFVDAKLEESFRVLGDMNMDPVYVDVELEETTRKDQDRDDQKLYRAEVNVKVPGRLLRAEESAQDLEQAIVQMKHTLTRELRKWHDRLVDESRKGARRAKEMFGAEAPKPDDDIDEWEGYEEGEEEAAG
jgi:ribosomal subunit interface protein